jgi:hypothetical protein
LKEHSDKLLQTLTENLPDMNLKECMEENKGSEEEEILPLDFRTAIIQESNKVIIQAKPLSMKTDAEFLAEAEKDAKRKAMYENIPLDQRPLDDYLEAVKLEDFKEDDKNVIMIEPDIDIKKKFEQVDLECNKDERINNTF